MGALDVVAILVAVCLTALVWLVRALWSVMPATIETGGLLPLRTVEGILRLLGVL